MEEGHFDKEGTYIFGKHEKDEVKDHWLDNIDWVKVNSQAASNTNPSDEESMDTNDYLKKFDPIPIYKEMLTLLLPGETVLKALKRLGGGKVQTASERWKKKKKQQDEGDIPQTNELNKENIAKLTEHANSILSNMGNMDIYQETFEGIRFKITKSVEVSTQSTNDLDMFGEMFDEKNKADSNKRESESVQGEPITKKVRFNEDEGQANRGEIKPETVQWEFKWKQDEESEVHGPHSTAEMLDWVCITFLMLILLIIKPNMSNVYR
jgi:CD2 antigen cytoplasmic tail-binding protein 2